MPKRTACEGVKPPMVRQCVEKHQRTRMRAAWEGRDCIVCTKGAAVRFPGRGIPKVPTRAPRRETQLKLPVRPGIGKQMAVEVSTPLSLLLLLFSHP